AVTVLIERQQFCARIGDFVGIDDAVVIHVKRPDNRRDGRMMTETAAATRSTAVAGRRAALITTATRGWTVLSVVLCTGQQCGGTDRHDGEDGFNFHVCFHNFYSWPFVHCVSFSFTLVNFSDWWVGSQLSTID